MKKSRQRGVRSRPTATVAPPTRGRWLAPALIAAAVLLSYANALSGPFIFDDRGTIIDNPTIEDLWSRQVLSAPHETPVAGRPVVNLSFALNYAVHGRDVTGYHASNIAIHLLNALVLFAIARRAQPSAGSALAIAVIWAVHPLNTEAVNYVTQRTESLMALFYLLTIYCAIRAHEVHGRRGRWEAAAVGACALGMASKESMVTAPLAVLLFDRVFLFDSLRGAVRARARLYGGLAATWLVLAGLLWSAPRSLSAGFSAHDADAWTYLLNQAVMVARYLRLAVWPRDLVLYYGWPVPLTIGAVLPQVALVVALLALTGLALVRWPRLGFLGAWVFLTLAPTSSIVPIATEVGAERRMYLALIGIVALAVVAGRRWLPGGVPGRDAGPTLKAAGPTGAPATLSVGPASLPGALASLPGALASLPGIGRLSIAVVVLMLGAGTFVRNRDYQSSLRLAETSAERWPTPGAHSMLGTELAAAGRLSEAEPHLREAASVHPPARYYLATVLNAQGRRAEAIPHFTSFIDSQPPALDQVHLARALLAEALTKEGRLDEAAAQYRSMLATHPDDDQAITLLAAILLRQQRFAEAIPLFQQAVAARQDDVSALGGLGVALASTGRLVEAIEVFRRAVAIDPQNEGARQNLARALALQPR